MLLVWAATDAFSGNADNKNRITGSVIDGADKSSIMQATVQILSLPDSAMVAGNVSDMNGNFQLSVRPGKYLLKVSYVGYTPYFKELVVKPAPSRVNVGQVVLESDAIMLEGAVVVAQAPEVTAVADTLVYSSSAYRLPEGSALEELVKKLPGAEIDDDGKVTINGKSISKIMIDGKEFFANDPNVALKNLPVNIIDKVRAYDKQSDMARMTGVDDGEEETVLDLSVKPGMNKGWFGNADVAAGSKDRYSGKLLANYFRDGSQLTIIGSANNVNDNSFPGGGGGFRRKDNGLTAIKMGGLNFATESEKFKSEGSVNFNYKDADQVSKQSSETFVSSESSSFKNLMKRANDENTNLVADFRLEWKPDTMTTFIFRPRVSYGLTDNLSDEKSYTFSQDPGYATDELLWAEDITSLVPEENVLNRVLKNSLSHKKTVKGGGSMIANRRLGTAGRNITFRGKFNYTNQDTEQSSISETEYFQKTPEERWKILNRYITTPTTTRDYSASLTYSEPIFRGGFLQFSYNFQYKHSSTENSTYDMPEGWLISDGWGDGSQGVYNKDLSKTAVYKYYNHQVDVTFRWIREKMRLNAGVSLQPQRSNLTYRKGDYDIDTVRNVFNFTPTLDFRYNFSKTSQLRLTYRGRSSQPDMLDLLPITDDTDLLNIKKGNPGLKPSFTNELRMMFNRFNAETQRGVFSHFQYQNELNSVSSRRTYDENTGGYTTMPENINGNWNLFGMVGTNTALRNKKYTINTFTRCRYQNMVGYISSGQADAEENVTKSLSLGERLRGTYRNDWWELSLNGSLDYSHSRNNFQEQNNLDTYQFSYGASTNVRLPWNMNISTDLSQNSRRGYVESAMNTDELIWNAQISRDFLKGNAATVSVQFYDILRQQSNISRTISSAMRQDTEYNAIYSYCMVHFIYRLNVFGGKGKGPGPGRGMGHGPMMPPRHHF